MKNSYKYAKLAYRLKDYKFANELLDSLTPDEIVEQADQLSSSQKENLHSDLSKWWSQNKNKYKDQIEQVKKDRDQRYEATILYPLVDENGAPYFDESESAFYDTLTVDTSELEDLREQAKDNYLRIMSIEEKKQHTQN